MCCCTGGCATIVARYERDVAVRQQADKEIQALPNGCQSNKDAIIAAGAVPLLGDQLRLEQPALQEPAAYARTRFSKGTRLLSMQQALAHA